MDPLIVTANPCGSDALITTFPLLIHQAELPHAAQVSAAEALGGEYDGGGGGGGSTGPQPGN